MLRPLLLLHKLYQIQQKILNLNIPLEITSLTFQAEKQQI